MVGRIALAPLLGLLAWGAPQPSRPAALPPAPRLADSLPLPRPRALTPATPAPVVSSGPTIPPTDAAALREAMTLLAAIETAARNREVEVLIALFTQLHQVRSATDGKTRAAIDTRMQALTNQCYQSKLSLQLQIYVNEGNQHLRAIAQHVRSANPIAAHDSLKKVEALFLTMRSEKRAVFHRNGEALLRRARALYTRAVRPKPKRPATSGASGPG